MEEKMLAYLQERLTNFKKLEKQGYPSEYLERTLDSLIACKRMVECLIQKPVNLQKDGKVTVGLE